MVIIGSYGSEPNQVDSVFQQLLISKEFKRNCEIDNFIVQEFKASNVDNLQCITNLHTTSNDCDWTILKFEFTSMIAWLANNDYNYDCDSNN